MKKIGGTDPEMFTGTSVQVLDNPLGLELFAEGLVNLFAAGPNISMSLYSPRSDPSGHVHRVVVGRIVMPAHGAHALAVALFDFLNKTGLNPDNQGRPPGSTRAN